MIKLNLPHNMKMVQHLKLLNIQTEENTLYVSEIFKKDNKITFGFEDPIIYNKIKKFN